MALYHFHVTQIKRSEGRTAVASAAYRAGEKIHNLWDGETHDYTKKGGVILANRWKRFLSCQLSFENMPVNGRLWGVGVTC